METNVHISIGTVSMKRKTFFVIVVVVDISLPHYLQNGNRNPEKHFVKLWILFWKKKQKWYEKCSEKDIFNI